ncbi:RagB/SusD family nutrient uptake outer membrane protein [Hwangdonia sp.]|uniref:RagB/SusD family nutrient uptake outer membrane protein n=1 Tax=Hwangdonia sp. TaxID=1883432 RepID=UPI003AB4B125
MKLIKYITCKKALSSNLLIPHLITVKFLVVCGLVFNTVSCDSFVDIDAPDNVLITETVFEDAATVKSALANIYYKMREQGLISGTFGMSIAIGTYSDELDYYGFNSNSLKLYDHNLTASDGTVSNWWRHGYNLIYAANDIIKGIEESNLLQADQKNEFKGQALFIRAYLHSLLAGLFGDIPYITTTNYSESGSVSRMPLSTVYEFIVSDLTQAVGLLENHTSGERVIPDQSTANALLARVYLYTENWLKAEETASALISAHTLEPDIDQVFLKNSMETLWQFKPKESGIINTQEGQALIITFLPTRGYALTNNLLEAFEPGDLRRSHWVGEITSTDSSTTLYYAHKYKETINTSTSSLEHSIIFRLSEQYLIRAEARAHLGNISGALQDLNTIRQRAGLGNKTVTTLTDVLDAIIKERQVELFTEHGQRWFDLKRTGRASEILQPIKTNWSDNHVLLPIPDTDLLANPNLKPQNPGY